MRLQVKSLLILLPTLFFGCATLDMETHADGGRSAHIRAWSFGSKVLEKLTWTQDNTRTSESTGADKSSLSGDHNADTSAGIVATFGGFVGILKELGVIANSPAGQAAATAFAPGATAFIPHNTGPTAATLETPPVATLPDVPKLPTAPKVKHP